MGGLSLFKFGVSFRLALKFKVQSLTQRRRRLRNKQITPYDVNADQVVSEANCAVMVFHPHRCSDHGVLHFGLDSLACRRFAYLLVLPEHNTSKGGVFYTLVVVWVTMTVVLHVEDGSSLSCLYAQG